jgi:uncharacterized protein YcbK (DUF882 family)
MDARDRTGRLGRRHLLGGLAGAAALSLLSGCGGLEPLPSPWRPGSRLDLLVPTIDPFLDVTHAHTGDRAALSFVAGGDYDRRALRRLDWVFRDWRQNHDPEIDRRIYWALAALSNEARRQGASGRIELLSGYRTRRTNRMLRARGVGAAANSYHTRRRAADIRLDGIPAGQVADWAEWLQIGGVGRYPGNRFTHIDSGELRGWSG